MSLQNVKEAAKRTRDLADSKWGKRLFLRNLREPVQLFNMLKGDLSFGHKLWQMVNLKKPEPEQFEEAVKRLGLTKKDLQAREREFLRMARVCFGLTAFAFMWSILFAKTPAAAIISFMLSFLGAIQWIGWSMRTWQVRNKKLCELLEFVSTPGWWKVCFQSS